MSMNYGDDDDGLLEMDVNIAPGGIADSVKVMTYSPEGISSCMKCNEHITSQQKYFNFHDACLTCETCGEELQVTYKDGPAETWCRRCGMRAKHEEEEAADARSQATYDAARDILLDGGGTREDREAAISAIESHCYEEGSSW